MKGKIKLAILIAVVGGTIWTYAFSRFDMIATQGCSSFRGGCWLDPITDFADFSKFYPIEIALVVICLIAWVLVGKEKSKI